MIFGFAILLVALTISLVAAYYSIMGLTAIFAAATIPIIIMGGVLELGKVISTVWLHSNWRRVPFLFKAYLVPAVAFLMFLTSMGIFGFLSQAHLDQGIPSGDIAAQVSLYDEKIKTQRDNIESARRALKQMDATVDETIARSKTDQGAVNANAMRQRQAKERTQIQADIAKAQTEITKLQEQRAPVASQARKVEAEVGPIKYIAAFLYGDNPDANLLEQAVRWVIILIVIVFDPLALCLILAANKQFEWARKGRGGWIHDQDGTIVGVQPPEEEVAKAEEKKTDLDLANEIIQQGVTNSNPADNVPVVEPVEDLPFKGQGLVPSVPFTTSLTFNRTHVKRDIKKRRERKNREKQTIADNVPLVAEETLTATEPLVLDPTEMPHRVANPEAAPGPNRGVMYSQPVQADNLPTLGKASNTSFGSEFPGNPEKGDVYLRVDYLPNRLFKFNGSKWIEVDKTQTDLYAYDELYIQHLITEIDAGRYDVDSLTDLEREQIQQQLNKKA
jgi:hypothetical protein